MDDTHVVSSRPNEDQAGMARERTELALERTVMASERTLSAWIRTGLASIVTGLGIARWLSDEGTGALGRSAGVLFILIGVGVYAIGLRGYAVDCKKFARPGIRMWPGWVLASVALGLLASAGLSLMLVFV